MGVRDTSAIVRSRSDNPPGCWKCHRTTCDHELFFNTLTTSTTTCGTGTYPNYPCLCATGPLCSETDGTTANSAGCICGAAACTPTTGLYCVSSSSTCSRGSACSNNNGALINTVDCSCGTSACNSFNGMYCISSLNICHKACSLGEYRSAGTNGECT